MCAHLWNWLVPKMARQIENVIAAAKNPTVVSGRSAAPAATGMETKQLFPLVSTKSWRGGFLFSGWGSAEGGGEGPPRHGTAGRAPGWGGPTPDPRGAR